MTARSVRNIVLGILILSFDIGVFAQQPTEPVGPSVAVPRLMTVSGILRDRVGRPLSGVVGVSFAMYKDQEGGAPLWMETQNIAVDDQGRYSVLLGATETTGLPMQFFSSGESRWIGIHPQVVGEEEQPRVLLVSVPYALKSADADTLGGLPVEAFLRAPQPGVTDKADAEENGSTTRSIQEPKAELSSGTQNYIGKFAANGVDLVDSQLYDDGAAVAIGTAPAFGKFHVSNGSNPAPSVPTDAAIVTSGTGGVKNRVAVTDGSKVTYLGTVGASNYGEFSTYDYATGQAFNLIMAANGGYVGVGGIAPIARLHVYNGGGPGANVPAGGALLTSGSGPANRVMVTDGSKVTYLSTVGSANYGEFSTYDYASGTAFNLIMAANGGNVGIGTINPTEKLEAAGNIKANGTVIGSQIVSTVATGTAPLAVNSTTVVPNLNAGLLGNVAASKLQTRGINYLHGCDFCSSLSDTEDQGDIYMNNVAPMTITKVSCITDSGSATINIKRDDGTAANILSANLSCSTSFNSTTTFASGEVVLSVDDRIDFDLVSVGGGAKRITLAIQTVINP